MIEAAAGAAVWGASDLGVEISDSKPCEVCDGTPEICELSEPIKSGEEP